MPYSIQPSYKELTDTQKHPVAVALEAAMQGKMAYNQAQEFKAKQEQQKQEAYFNYRKSGFSQSDAWQKAQLGGPSPTEDDTVGMEKKKSDLEMRKTEAEIPKIQAETSKLNTEATQPQFVWKDADGNTVPSGTPGARQFMYNPGNAKNPLKALTAAPTETERASTRVGNVILGKLGEVKQLLSIDPTKRVVGNKDPITPLGPITNWNPRRSEGSKKLQDTLNASYDLLAMLRTGKQGEKTQVGQIKKEYPVGENDTDETIIRRIEQMETEINGFMTGAKHSPLDDGGEAGSAAGVQSEDDPLGIL